MCGEKPDSESQKSQGNRNCYEYPKVFREYDSWRCCLETQQVHTKKTLDQGPVSVTKTRGIRGIS